jgi:hypothetical protein
MRSHSFDLYIFFEEKEQKSFLPKSAYTPLHPLNKEKRCILRLRSGTTAPLSVFEIIR